MAKAATQLHVTPATLSVQIRELEKFMGHQLFKKSGRGIELTETGESVYRYATDIFATGEEMINSLRGQPMGSPQLLRVGVKDIMPKIVAFKFIQPALELNTPVRLICREGDVATLVSELSIHRLDVVLSDTPIDPGIKVKAYSHLLGESTVSLFAVEGIAKKLRKEFPRSLHRAPFLLPTTDTVLRHSLEQWFEENEIVPDVRCEFEDAAMLKIAGQSGLGIVAMPTIISDEVRTMYGLNTIAELPVVERFYALSVERKLKHPAVVAISNAAKSHVLGM